MCYQLERGICAVLLRPSCVATKLRVGSLVRVIGPSRKVPGLIEVECDHTPYAVFEVDLEDYGEIVEVPAAHASIVP